MRVWHINSTGSQAATTGIYMVAQGAWSDTLEQPSRKELGRKLGLIWMKVAVAKPVYLLTPSMLRDDREGYEQEKCNSQLRHNLEGMQNVLLPM